jgi:anti-anti-sigma factor
MPYGFRRVIDDPTSTKVNVTVISLPALSRCVDVGGAYIRVETWQATTVVAVTGEIDALNADFTATVLHGFATGPDPIALDLSELEFIGTQGLRMLVEFDDRCRLNDVVWTLVPCRMLSRLLELVDIGRQLPISGSVDAAVQRLMCEAPSPRTGVIPRVAQEKLRC